MTALHTPINNHNSSKLNFKLYAIFLTPNNWYGFKFVFNMVYFYRLRGRRILLLKRTYYYEAYRHQAV